MSLQAHARTPLEILSTNLEKLIAQPDPEAAESLNTWMIGLKRIEELQGLSYGQRLVIIRNFEERSLWRYLTDPETEVPFPNLTAWLSSGFIGCRRVNMDAHVDGKKLADIPAEKLIDVPKSSIKVLTGVSTAVRNLPDVLEAAKRGDEKLLNKLEKDHPGQHVESKGEPIRLAPGRSDRKVIDRWVQYAIEHDIAGSMTDAIVKACEMAMHDAELDEELAHMPAEETTA